MGEVEQTKEDAPMVSQAKVWQCTFSVVESMALKCAVELRIADILQSHGGGPVSLAQIASALKSPSSSVNLPCLERLLRFLVHKNLFSACSSSSESDDDQSTEKILYMLNDNSRWLLNDHELSVAPEVLFTLNPLLINTLHHLSHVITEGNTTGFKKAYGRELWELTSGDPQINKMFNHGMANASKNTIKVVISMYSDGFASIKGSLVDVGGNVGFTTAEILKAHPHIRGINFDLPHVIAAAPKQPGITYVGGDMFDEIPFADAIFIKSILHDWGDEDCVRILKNCRKAIPEEGGKVIIVDIVLDYEGNDPLDTIRLAVDLLMVTYFKGKERTKLEWKKLLEESGFPRFNIIKIAAPESIIEAYPK